jgi:predicted ATPase
MMARLQKIVLRGFKSIRDMTLEFRPLNILIGANGAGKSNLVLFFKMLNETAAGRLQQFVAAYGFGHSLVFISPKTTREVWTLLSFLDGDATLTREMRFHYVANDTLAFFSYGPRDDSGYQHASQALDLPSTSRVYHFHDTSTTARVKQHCYVDDNRELASDAGNLAAVLNRLKTQNGGAAYSRIVKTIRMIAPFFDDFDLAPSVETGRDIILNWRHVESADIFGPHQLSDGTLRAMCLVTLLLQPEDELPNLVVVDEPELGLHPYALNVIASLLQKASHHTQVLVSTQSSTFLDNFTPEDIIVVDRTDKESTFRRLGADELKAWLEEYSLGEIWEKNVIQGGPH